MYRMATEDSTSNTNRSFYSGLIALLIISIAFFIPLALWFSIAYNASGGTVNSLLLFIGIFGFAFLVTLVYYRMGVQDDVEAKIDRISGGKVRSIAATTFVCFLIVLITIFILAVNPDLITIFENTIGIWFIGLIGYSNFANEIFHSDIFSQLRKESKDPKIFNQTFLLTQFNNENIDDFIKFYKADCDEHKDLQDNVELPFDFQPAFENEGQLNALRKIVNLKRTAGYFSWIYFTSIISLTISIISVTMKTV